MATEEQVSEAQIAVHWREEEYSSLRRSSSPRRTRPIRASSSGSVRSISRSASRSTPTCSTGTSTGTPTLDTSNPPFWKWFVGGRLNACVQLRRPPPGRPPEQGSDHLGARAGGRGHRSITYQELYPGERVRRAAPGLRWLKTGDRVTFHLPMVPELPVSMLACARLGVIHSEVFGGFSGAACGEPHRRLAAATSW